MDALRPRTLVELGTHTGFSFFAFAELADRLGLDTRLFALDSWEGDDHAGFYDESVYESVKAIAEADFPHRTELIRGYFSESAPRIDDNSVELLHIDGRHGYEDVREDFEEYLPKVADNGVVLFHDCYEFREGFGVHRFWDEIADRWPSFRFHHGHGLGVLAVGTDVPDSVLAFIEYANSHEHEVRDFYAQLGARVTEEYVVREQAARAGALEAEIADLRASTSWKVTSPLRALGALRLRGRS
ncbi:class I SAM-dependent methyltransferase [Protaetiibacter larvae]|nr:class I SAM-dependent methyltransferase [Protaetiibacter larvae]